MNKSIDDIRLIDDKEKLFNECILKCKESQESVNAFVTITDKFECSDLNGALGGVPYSLKDN